MGFADVAVDFPAQAEVESEVRLQFEIILREGSHIDGAEVLDDGSGNSFA